MFLLWHPSLTAINLSYTFPIFETSATALCGTTGNKLAWSRTPASELLQSNQPRQWQVDFEDTNLSLAARSIRMAVEFVKETIPAFILRSSMLAHATSMSSSCTGVYTAEVGMAIVQKLSNRKWVKLQAARVACLCVGTGLNHFSFCRVFVCETGVLTY